MFQVSVVRKDGGSSTFGLKHYDIAVRAAKNRQHHPTVAYTQVRRDDGTLLWDSEAGVSVREGA